MGKNEFDKARRAAAEALVRVHKGGWANLALDSALAGPGLHQRDRAFAGALFYGAAERLATLDWLLAPHLKRPVDKLDTEVRAILETGAYQLLYMRVPQSAAVNESVKLARAMGKTSAAGLVNAVLRKTASLRREDESGAPLGPDFAAAAFKDEEERVRVKWSVGPAVARAVMEAMPQDYDAFFAASFGAGGLCLRANTLKTTLPQLCGAFEKKGVATLPGDVPGSLYADLPGGVEDEELFVSGMYHVQGEASQAVCACVLVEPGLLAQPGLRVLDLCAAPGGKSATLAQYMGGGAGLTACDIHPHRVELIEKTFARLGVEGAAVLQNDAAEYRPELAGQDAVLCDVPCSGLGVLAAKPDLRYTHGTGFEELPALQMKILSTACRYVKKGGRLVYSTCTIRRQENEDVVAAFLAQNPGFGLVAPACVPPGADVKNSMMTILPQKTGLDGFFVAVMECL